MPSARGARALNSSLSILNEEAYILKKELVIFSLSALLAASSLAAQSPLTSSSLLGNDPETDGGSYRPSATTQNAPMTMAPFSRIAIGGSFSTLGPGIQITTNLASHLNLRATGNGFAYSTNFTTSGFNASAKLNLASAGIVGDIYPFQRSGFRISPGLLVINNNKISAASNVAGGTSFTLNGDTYYSANANAATGATPLTANGLLGLNSSKPAFTITGGWGNTIPRSGRHWSFPGEVGVALTGAPSVSATLNGWACYDQAQTECTNVASTTDTIALQIQSDLAAQIAKWKNNLNPLKTYPIASFGVAYSFGIRGAGGQ
jgi:hypothetical protein